MTGLETITSAEAVALRDARHAMRALDAVLDQPGSSITLLEELDQQRDALTWLLGSERCAPGEVLLRSALGISGHGARMSPPDSLQMPRVAQLLARMPWAVSGLVRLAAINPGWHEAVEPLCKAARLEVPCV
jgi:hypothetical protein